MGKTCDLHTEENRHLQELKAPGQEARLRCLQETNGMQQTGALGLAGCWSPKPHLRSSIF